MIVNDDRSIIGYKSECRRENHTSLCFLLSLHLKHIDAPNIFYDLFINFKITCYFSL